MGYIWAKYNNYSNTFDKIKKLLKWFKLVHVGIFVFVPLHNNINLEIILVLQKEKSILF
jgi:hypothetical protein